MKSKVNEVIRQIYLLDKQEAEIKAKRDAMKEALQLVFDEKGLKKIDVKSSDVFPALTATKTEKAYIDFLPDKIREKFEKELANEMINRSYSINNMDGLIRLLKEYEVPPSEFKKFITAVETANKEKIKQLYAVGDVTQKQLKGCFNARITKSISVKVCE